MEIVTLMSKLPFSAKSCAMLVSKIQAASIHNGCCNFMNRPKEALKSIAAYDHLAQVDKQNFQLACVFLSAVQLQRIAGDHHIFPVSPRPT